MVPTGNEAKRLSSVKHTTKTIHHPHHHHHHHQGVKGMQTVEAATNCCYSQGKTSCAMKSVISKKFGMKPSLILTTKASNLAFWR